jgi:hypothetical protein
MNNLRRHTDMKKTGFFIIIFILLSFVIGLTACSRGDLVGTWEISHDNEKFRLEFFSDGHIDYHEYYKGEWYVIGRMEWSSDKNRLSIQGLLTQEIEYSALYTFSISGNTLTLTFVLMSFHDRLSDELETHEPETLEPVTLIRVH